MKVHVATSLALILAACGQETANQTNATAPAAAAAPSGATPEPTGTPAEPAPVLAAIQTQPGPKGSQIALNKVAVVGNIMTVQLTATGGECCAYADLDEVAAIDDTTTRRIAVLKDDGGKWLAAPLDTGTQRLRFQSSAREPLVIWLKFPAPPPTSPTVSITIPQVGPFDGVPVAR